MDKTITIELSEDEALALFDRLAKKEAKSATGEAEQRALWMLEGALERALAEPFAKDSRELVAQARARILHR